jgi:hypothetical protein
MQIFVRVLDGKTITLEVTRETSVREIKFKVKHITGTPMSFQRLIWRGRQLKDTDTAGQLPLESLSSLQLVGRLLAGQVFLDLPDGTDEACGFYGSFSRLRKHISRAHGIPEDQIMLPHHGRTIEDTDVWTDICPHNYLFVLIELIDIAKYAGMNDAL